MPTLGPNFLRTFSLIVDHGTSAMRCLLDNFFQKQRISFKDFVSKNQHDIYHHFTNVVCCQCCNINKRQCTTVISIYQMEKLFEKDGPKLQNHKQTNTIEYCCCTVKETLELNDIDITLLRFFLVTYFELEFWQNCITGGMLFHEFLNKHLHDIFHLMQLDTLCCLCTPDYTPPFVTKKEKLAKFQWEKMFVTDNSKNSHNQSCIDKRNPCSVTAIIRIDPFDLSCLARHTILTKFSDLMKHMDHIVNARNEIVHGDMTEIPYEKFEMSWNEISNSILYLSQVTNTYIERSQAIIDLKAEQLDNTFEEEASPAKDLSLRMKVASCVFYILLFGSVLALIIAMITVGSIHLHDCPEEKNLPIFLIVLGIATLVVPFICISICISICKKDENGNENKLKNAKRSPLIYLIAFFFISWLIAGNVWVFGKDFNLSAESLAHYCHPSVYLFANRIVQVIDGLLGSACIIGIGAIMCYAFQTFETQDSVSVNYVEMTSEETGI